MSIVQIIILSIIGLAGGGIIAAGCFALITTHRRNDKIC